MRLESGDPIWYRQTCAGGYGFQRDIPAVFLRWTEKRVVIRVTTANHERTVRIAVSPMNVQEEGRMKKVKATGTQLVCEGACNGGRVAAFDEAIRTVSSRIAVSDYWLQVAREFVYTAHDAQSEYDYRCRVCGAERFYGGRGRVRVMEGVH